LKEARFAISSWSLHGLITCGLLLVDVPAQIAEHGIELLEVCHFHFPNIDEPYVEKFRRSIENAGVKFSTLLIDIGDIANPDDVARERDIAAIREWIVAAGKLGGSRVRICAGRQAPTEEVIARSTAGLKLLTDFARTLGVEVITENWLETSLKPAALVQILEQCGPKLGLCADTGNAEGDDKYDTLAQLLPRASAVHYKARYTASGDVEHADLERCIQLIDEAGYVGPVTLIYGDTKDEWQEVDRLKAAILAI
jgi:sugar phosphate isomerase/epimerase